MHSAEAGRGSAKAIITLAVLAAIIFVAVKALPVYVHAYELQDHIRELAIQSMAGQHPTVEAVKNNIMAKAADLDLPVQAGDVKVAYAGGRIVINLDYTVPVDLYLFVLPMHFTPSAENRSLT